jgi:RNA-directed DNA polymerase
VHLRETWPTLREIARGHVEAPTGETTTHSKERRWRARARHSNGARPIIQQALLQVLQPQFDPAFSSHNRGFRPGRRAHDAVCAAQRYIQEGHRWVVDVDLENFFDRVNHDVLMGRLERRIADTRVLRLIRPSASPQNRNAR